MCAFPFSVASLGYGNKLTGRMTVCYGYEPRPDVVPEEFLCGYVAGVPKMLFI